MKSLISIFLGVVLAVTLGTLFIDTSSNTETVSAMGSYGSLTAFQVGAFTDYESAAVTKEKHKGIIIKDDIYYLVYVALLSNSINIDKMMKYLDDNKIYYYLKTIDATNEFIDELYKYEELMKATTSNVAFLQLNSKVIELYEATYAS